MNNKNLGRGKVQRPGEKGHVGVGIVLPPPGEKGYVGVRIVVPPPCACLAPVQKVLLSTRYIERESYKGTIESE